MIENDANRFNCSLPLYGALGAMVILLPKVIFGSDLGTFLLSVVVSAIVGLILLVVVVRAIRRHSISVLLMLAVFCAVAWLLFRVSDDVHTTGRWLLQSQAYKAKVLAQPEPANGELKHVEWEGWGFAGSGDTTVYLVFDPNNSLAIPAKSHSPGKFSGVPCTVLSVRRLENNWYTVLFYTDTAWDYCGSEALSIAMRP